MLKFEYLLRIDALSTPSGNPDAPELALSVEEDAGLAGFARLRLRTGDAGPWAEFVGPDGRLRRDLVKAKVAALLAASLKPGEQPYFSRSRPIDIFGILCFYRGHRGS